MYTYHENENYIENKTIFECSSKDTHGIDLHLPISLKSITNKNISTYLEKNIQRTNNDYFVFPEMSEFQVVRHFTIISKNNFCIDTNTYPLGSCTMKYNPRINEWVANTNYFNTLHPYMNINTETGRLLWACRGRSEPRTAMPRLAAHRCSAWTKSAILYKST